MLSSLSGVLYSIRPSACLGAALFASSAHKPVSDYPVNALIFLAVFSGSACCFLINDLADREKDLLNRKNRPIATGQLSSINTAIAVLVFASVYLVISMYLGLFHLFIFGTTMLIFTIYPAINNRFGLVANLLVAFSVCLSFVYGAGTLYMESFLSHIIFSTFFVITVREIMLDGLDVTGDRMIGKPSIPIRYEKKAVWFVAAGYFLGTLPVLMLIISATSEIVYTILAFSLILLWVPFIVSIRNRKINWMLYNVRASHLFFGLIIIALIIK